MSVSNFDTLINKFKENSLTHPNISRFWITYLELKKKSYERKERCTTVFTRTIQNVR